MPSLLPLLLAPFGLQESKEEESSREVKTRSTKRRETVIVRSGVDSRNFINFVLHGALLGAKTCPLEKNRCHFCLLCQLFVRFWIEFSTFSIEIEDCEFWIVIVMWVWLYINGY